MVKLVKEVFWNFFNGDIWWARLRLVFLFVCVDLVAMAVAYTFETTSPMWMWHNIVFPTIIFMVVFRFIMLLIHDGMEADKAQVKLFNRFLLLGLFFAAIGWFEWKLVHRTGLPGAFVIYYLIPPLAVVIITIFAAARYVQDIYDLESYRIALLYISSSFWGIVYPKLTVDDGQYQIEPGKVNRLALIGGPGYLTVKPGTAVILDDKNYKSKVFSSEKVFLSHYGSILAIIDLNIQLGCVPSVSAVTKDGITITIRDIQFRYRIWSAFQPSEESIGRSRTNPYPYDEQAVRDSVYNLTVPGKGLKPLSQEVSDKEEKRWSQMVEGTVVGQIKNYITERQLDEIVTPNFQQHQPRNEIRRQLFSTDTEKKLKGIGARLLWCDIGHFETDKAVHDQRLETWSAKWTGNANLARARGEAQRLAYQEIGRAEAQADVIMSIIHAFDDIDLSVENKDQNIRKIVYLRSAQVLEALTTTKPLENDKRLSSTSSNDSKDKDGTKV